MRQRERHSPQWPERSYAVSRAPVRPGPRTGAAKMRNGAASTAYVTLRKKSVTLNMNVFCPTPRRK